MLLDDKLVCKNILTAAGIPQPALIAYGNGKKWFDTKGLPIGTEKLNTLISQHQQVVIKPSQYSSGGEGVHILKFVNGNVCNQDGSTFSASRYSLLYGSAIIEEFVAQSSFMNELHSASVNTIRTITTFNELHEPSVRYCILKLGRGDQPADNAHVGGLYLAMDIETGALAPQAYDESFSVHRVHPENGVRFEGRKLDSIHELVGIAKRCAALFPEVPYIGWDIAITEDGPVIIEGNSSPGLTNIQRTHGGVAGELRKYLPKPNSG
ncbi:sugar-transfer associated ATP-grasp domain-containing protein [Nocardia vinacea]|uniref:sugar-transfer associated ATP-grasp domain-containing protein n=1 Tax=Nocardia vinacea TaxID=96468 RepID=UPI00146CFD4C|nr:sugar-transfer associated ATP-grasp domain-containing protein [Nocardia vinacea]